MSLNESFQIAQRKFYSSMMWHTHIKLVNVQNIIKENHFKVNRNIIHIVY